MRWTSAAAIVVALTAGASAAHAQASAGDVALAETLFQEAQKLMKEGHYAEACPKFQESQRLDPGGGTLFQLATCHSFTGRTASAWAEFSEVALLAKQRNRPDIERAAKEQIQKLEVRLSWLTIDVSNAARSSGLSVRRDGTLLGPATYGTAMPADPGKHTIVAEAPGYRAWSATVELGNESDRKSVVVPALEKLPEPPELAPPEHKDALPAVPEPRRHPPAFFYASAGVALAGLGTAAYFGIRSYNKEREASRTCPNSECSDPNAVAASETAITSANIANVAAGVGLVGAGVFTYLMLTNPRAGDAKQSTSLHVVPRVGPNVLALGIQGRL